MYIIFGTIPINKVYLLLIKAYALLKATNHLLIISFLKIRLKFITNPFLTQF